MSHQSDAPSSRSAGGDEVVRTEALTKVYRSGTRDRRHRITAVDALDLSGCKGEIFGLLGPNGAGKTTTVGMLTTRIQPTSGRAFVNGVDVVADPAQAKSSIGVVHQVNTLDPSLNVFENLYFHRRYYAMSHQAASDRAEALLERLRLAHRAQVQVRSLSGGMAQRLMVARAVMHRPALLFLDEPTAGLDPQSRLALWEMVGELHDSGQTILLTTHSWRRPRSFATVSRSWTMQHHGPGHPRRPQARGGGQRVADRRRQDMAGPAPGPGAHRRVRLGRQRGRGADRRRGRPHRVDRRRRTARPEPFRPPRSGHPGDRVHQPHRQGSPRVDRHGGHRRPPPTAADGSGPFPRSSRRNAFFRALLLRDLTVRNRDLKEFPAQHPHAARLAGVRLHLPVPRIGQGIGGSGNEARFSTLLLGGLVAQSIVFQDLFRVALPMARELDVTNELEHRVLVPASVSTIAFEKIVAGALQSLFAGLIVFPVAAFLPATPIYLQVDWPVLVTMVRLACYTAAALGLTLGTRVEPRLVPLLSSPIALPLAFFGAIFYTWDALASMASLQYLVLVNPLVYISEGLRAGLSTGEVHMPVAAVYAVLLAFAALSPPWACRDSGSGCSAR